MDLNYLGEKNILIVENDYLNKKLLTSIFKKYSSFKIFFAIQGEEAIKILLEKKMDLIISNIELPGMGGLELIENIRLDNKYESIPIFIISGNGDFKEELIEDQVNEYILKPFVIEGFVQKIKQYLY